MKSGFSVISLEDALQEPVLSEAGTCRVAAKPGRSPSRTALKPQ